MGKKKKKEIKNKRVRGREQSSQGDLAGGGKG